MKNKLLNLFLVLFIFTLIAGCGKKSDENKSSENKEDNSWKSSISSDYTYFDTEQAEFTLMLKAVLSEEDVDFENEECMQEESLDYLVCYKLVLDSKEELFLLGSDKKTVSKYIIKGNPYKIKHTGALLSYITVLYISSDDTDKFDTEVNDTFLSSENLNKYFGTSYVFSHLKYEWERNEESFILTISPTSIVDQDEFEKTDDYKASVEKEEKRLEELEKQKQFEEGQKAKEAAEKLKAKNRTFTAGKYYVGEHIEPGRYNMIAVSGHGNCYVEHKVIESFRPGGGSIYIDRYNNVELEKGDAIEVTSSLKIKFEAVK